MELKTVLGITLVLNNILLISISNLEMNIKFLASLIEKTVLWNKCMQLDLAMWKGNKIVCWFGTLNSRSLLN